MARAHTLRAHTNTDARTTHSRRGHEWKKVRDANKYIVFSTLHTQHAHGASHFLVHLDNAPSSMEWERVQCIGNGIHRNGCCIGTHTRTHTHIAQAHGSRPGQRVHRNLCNNKLMVFIVSYSAFAKQCMHLFEYWYRRCCLIHA